MSEEFEEDILKEPKRDIFYWVDYWKRMKDKGCNNFDIHLEIFEKTKKEILNIIKKKRKWTRTELLELLEEKE